MDEDEKYLYDRIPDLEIVEIFLSELKKLDLSKISTEDLKEKINDGLPILNFGNVIWDNRYHIFRVRKNFENNSEPYKNLCAIGLPPAHLTPFNRANNEFEPIFYGAHNGDLSLFESCQNLTEEDRFEPQNFTMGIWKVKENMKLNLIPIVDSEIVHSSRNDIKNLSLRSEFSLHYHFKTDKVIKYSKLVSKFFADEFAKSEIKTKDDYKISSFFSNYIKEINKISEDKFDGILYPSVAHKFRGENVAIFPESLHKIEPVKCLNVTAYNFNFEKGTLTKGIKSEGEILRNEEIIWKEK
jgi:hypothetical protein